MPDPLQRRQSPQARPLGDGRLPLPEQDEQAVNGHSQHATAYTASSAEAAIANLT